MCGFAWERERESRAYLLSDAKAQEQLFVSLIYRWLSEHKWATEMLKNASGTPPPSLLILRETEEERESKWRERCVGEGIGGDWRGVTLREDKWQETADSKDAMSAFKMQ